MKDLDLETLKILGEELNKVCNECYDKTALFIKMNEIIKAHRPDTTKEFKNRILKEYNLEEFNK